MGKFNFETVLQGFFASVALFCSPSLQAQDNPAKPNILWLSAEDLSPDMPPYGDNTAHTPNLDKLAKEGQVFDLAFSSSPVCSASRSAIITGMYATRIGTHHHRSKVTIPPGVRTFTAYLRDAGYYCTNNDKTDYNFDVPADAWDKNGKNAKWDDRPTSTTPFFAVFNFTVTHESLFQTDDEQFAKRTSNVPDNLRTDPAKVKLPPYEPDTPVVRKDYAKYYDTITALDMQIGRVLDRLDKDGLASNTMVVFWGDHGRALSKGKRWVYDTGLQVPLIVRWPGEIKPRTRNEELVSLMDLGPTMLKAAGINPPDAMDGRVAFGPGKDPEPKYLIATRDRMDETYDMMRSVRDHRFRYIKNFFPEKPYDQVVEYAERTPTRKELRRLHEDGTLSGPATLFFAKAKPPEELYDTVADPHEIHNLADDPKYKATLVEMRKALAEWQEAIPDKGLEPESKADHKKSMEDKRKRKQEKRANKNN